MPRYHYRGYDATGATVTGELEAASEDAVAGQLMGRSIAPIDIAPVEAARDLLALLNTRFERRKVRLVDLIFFSRQMHTLLRAGVPILQALRGLGRSSQSPALARVIGDVVADLEAGLDLNGALRRHPEVFSSLFVSIVEVGETSGQLPEMFLSLSEYLGKEHEILQRISSALRYPMMVLIAISIAMVVINVLVIPAFAKVFATYGATLPLPTRILLATSHFTVHYWYLLLLAIAGIVTAVRTYVKTARGRLRWHRYKLRVPVIGPIVFQATLSRYAHALAISMHSGVPWTRAMTVVSHAVDNDYMAQHILAMRDGVERGETITGTAAATELFPPLILQMMAVGEETGAVDELLTEVGSYYDREVDYTLRNLASAIEPILIGIIGVLVLILALGVVLPMWDMGRVMLGR